MGASLAPRTSCHTSSTKMSTAVTYCLLFVLITTTVVAVEEKDHPAVETSAQEAEGEMKKLDADKDGKATTAEITLYMKQAFYSPETIHRHEANAKTKFTAAQIEEKAAADAKEYMKEIDTNNDGVLTHAELVAHYDANKAQTQHELEEADEDDDAEEGAEDEI